MYALEPIGDWSLNASALILFQVLWTSQDGWRETRLCGGWCCLWGVRCFCKSSWSVVNDLSLSLHWCPFSPQDQSDCESICLISGGVLFSLEEGASFLNQMLTWRMVRTQVIEFDNQICWLINGSTPGSSSLRWLRHFFSTLWWVPLRGILTTCPIQVSSALVTLGWASTLNAFCQNHNALCSMNVSHDAPHSQQDISFKTFEIPIFMLMACVGMSPFIQLHIYVIAES